MTVWAWYIWYRALVRAEVAVLRRQQADVSEDEARTLDRQLTEYLRLATQVIQRPSPKLILTHGVSGSGKSFWAQRVASEFGLTWIRSDVERKRLFAQCPDGELSTEELYLSTMTARTYNRLRELADVVLRSGWSVIFDATFLSRAQREPFRELSQELGIDHIVLSFHADNAVLRLRVLERRQVGRDPSDATL